MCVVINFLSILFSHKKMNEKPSLLRRIPTLWRQSSCVFIIFYNAIVFLLFQQKHSLSYYWLKSRENSHLNSVISVSYCSGSMCWICLACLPAWSDEAKKKKYKIFQIVLSHEWEWRKQRVCSMHEYNKIVNWDVPAARKREKGAFICGKFFVFVTFLTTKHAWLGLETLRVSWSFWALWNLYEFFSAFILRRPTTLSYLCEIFLSFKTWMAL